MRHAARFAKAGQWLALMHCRIRASAPPGTLATSMDLCDHQALKILLGVRPGLHSRLLSNPHRRIVGWGRRPSGERAAEIAALADSSLLLLEDGFLRAVARHDPPLSLVFDDLGIYYDAGQASRLERLIPRSLSEDETRRARALIRRWQDLGLSKHAAAPEFDGELPARYVLVVDQVAGDLSIRYGHAEANTFQKMLSAAASENPGATILVKAHPEAAARGMAGHFDAAALAGDPRFRLVAENCSPARLIRHALAVYTVTSQIGFEALIHGKAVKCFGMPHYAGWGLTTDVLPSPPRRGVASLEQLVHAALVEYPRYVDPETRTETEVETVIEHLALQRRHRRTGTVHAVGFSRWKHPVLRRFLAGAEVRFNDDAATIPAGATVAVWGPERPAGLPADARLLHVEDGFLRSSGLGADLVRPLSWVFDDTGLHCDPSRPSRLETILATHRFPADMVDRAERLAETIRVRGISKYNLAGPGWSRPHGVARVVLVPGQVESDASIRLGASGVRTNAALLEAVRARCPNAFVLYKPHPDVVSGLRRAGRDEPEAHRLADEVIVDADPALLLGAVDEVHTMTSLFGFEALIRGVPVTCHGQPFYAGWGLTTDVVPLLRRGRRLTLPELVAGALIEYPVYLSRVTGRFTTPERAVEELWEWRAAGPARPPRRRAALRAAVRLWAASGLKRNA